MMSPNLQGLQTGLVSCMANRLYKMQFPIALPQNGYANTARSVFLLTQKRTPNLG